MTKPIALESETTQTFESFTLSNQIRKAYSELWETSKMGLFTKIIIHFQPLTIFAAPP